MSTRLALVRHGQTEWHAENRYAGSSDVGLTEAGRQQAELLAGWAKAHRPTAIACSPLSRSGLTAAPAAAALGLEPEVHADLREVDFGVAEGRTLAEIRAADPAVADAFVRDPVASPFPGGEPLPAAADRFVNRLESLANAHPDELVLVVGHNTVIRLGLCRVLGIDMSKYRQMLAGPDNVALTELQVAEGSFKLLRFNAPATTNMSTF